MSDSLGMSVGRMLCANRHTYEFWLELDGRRVGGTEVWLSPEDDETLGDLTARATAHVLNRLSRKLGV